MKRLAACTNRFLHGRISCRVHADFYPGRTQDTISGFITREFGDMFKMGVVDPAKVTRTALQNAASVAGLLLTTDVLVTELKDEKEAIAGSVR